MGAIFWLFQTAFDGTPTIRAEDAKLLIFATNKRADSQIGTTC
jgi:hypothetical protein